MQGVSKKPKDEGWPLLARSSQDEGDVEGKIHATADHDYDSNTKLNYPRSILGSIVAWVYFCVPYSWISRDAKTVKKGEVLGGINGPIATFFLLLNSMIGSGIFVQPHVVKEVGILLALVLYITVGTAIYTGVDLLMKSAEKCGIFDYSKLAAKALGSGVQQLVDTVVVIGNFGSLVSYLLIIGTLANDIIEQYTGFSSLTLVTVIISACFVTPGCLIRSFGHLSFFAYFSMMAILGTFLFVVIAGPIETRGDNLNENLNYYSLREGFKNIGNIVFALGFSNSVFHAYVSVKDADRTAQNFSFISLSTVVVGLIVCIAFGVTGYLSFRDITESNILLNFNGSLGACFKILVIIHLLLYLPGDYIVLRFSFFRLVGIDLNDASDDLYIIGTIITLFVMLSVVCVLQVVASSNSLTYSLDMTGGIANSLTFFFFPGLIYLKSHTFSENPNTYIKSLVLATFGAALPFLVTYSLFVA